LPRPKKSFSPEFKDEAVKTVIEMSRPIAQMAKELDINEGTLGNWVAAYRGEHAGEEPPFPVTDRARLRELKRENRAGIGDGEKARDDTPPGHRPGDAFSLSAGEWPDSDFHGNP
jgi:transposase